MTRRPRPPRRRLLALVAYDGLRTFEYAIAADLFATERPYLGAHWYETIVVSPDRGRLRGVGGMEVKASAPFEAVHLADTVVVPGWRDLAAPPPARLVAALQAAHARRARIVSLCSGAFALGGAGLLDGRRATTHWLYAGDFKRRFPLAHYEPDALYVDEGSILTSAGSAAGLDACLHLVRRDFGPAVANTVARRMVVAPHREGGQAQYVEAPLPPHAGRGVGSAIDWARRRLHEPITVREWAARSAMSERTFLRRFSEAAGMPPLAWLQQQRVARARELFEARPALATAEVAAACGYESVETFRAAFRRIAGVAPAAYRARFAGPRG